MICPKCGFEQPDSPECMRCGIIVDRYKGPALGAAALRPPLTAPGSPPTPPTPAAAPPPFGDATMSVPLLPVAAMAGGVGTLYGDPVPVGAGGAVYGGPPPPPIPPTGSMAGVGRAPAFGVAHGDFGVGSVLGQTFSIYFANFLPFAVLAALALAPLYILEGYTSSLVAAQGKPSLTALSPVFLVLAVSVICRYFATAVITYGVFQQMRGAETSIGDCLSRGLSSLLPILGLAIVQGIAIWLGLIVCIIPGLILSLRWAVSIPAAVTERGGISDAMNRSAFLTDGFRGDIFSVLFVLGLLEIGIILLVNLVSLKNHSLHLILTDLSSMLVVGLSATAAAVMYYRLRDVKESIDVDQIAAVFA